MATNKFKFGTETPSKLYIGENEVTKAYMGETLVYEKSSSEQDELAGTWLFNDVLEIYSVFNYTINFTSNGTAYSVLKNDYSDELDWYFYYNNTRVYSPVLPKWSNSAYKTINITSKLSEVTNGDQLLAWLQVNATKQ